MDELSASNLMNGSHPILYRILQYLHLEVLKSFSEATDKELGTILDEVFDLYRKVNPWTHNKTQSFLKLYIRNERFDIERPNRIYNRYPNCR